ncbi:MAG: hypothetical protein LRS49_03825 [Desulfurococcales archaeon]|nr:hypothetical protein [Desulfurococcales archaeon]
MSSIVDPREAGSLAPAVAEGAPCECSGDLDEFADLAGLAASLSEAGSRGPALEVMALACAALRSAVEKAGVDPSNAVVPPPWEVVPLLQLALAIGAEGLYKWARSAIELATGTASPEAREFAESLAEAAGIPGARSLDDESLGASLLAYLAVAARVEEQGET